MYFKLFSFLNFIFLKIRQNINNVHYICTVNYINTVNYAKERNSGTKDKRLLH